ncbi:MAG: CoA transferase [Actinomycetota bacterium]|nr:CoA transferase [Actinomycetota bacterium]
MVRGVSVAEFLACSSSPFSVILSAQWARNLAYRGGFMSAALEGIRILDLSRLLPGPYSTLLLSDMGADVIKVEDPLAGDYLRFNPPLASSGMSIHFHTLNRNKRSIAIDLKKTEGRKILLELARNSEVLVEQFRPGVMDKLGLGYEAVKEVNPAIVYCSITGYGQNGPYRDYAGHDINYLGYSGILYSTGKASGPPVICGVQIADLAGGGMFAAISILAALLHAKKTGEGQFIDVSMMDGSASLLTINTGELFVTGRGPERESQLLWGATPCYNVYEAKDGYIALGAIEEKFWKRLCELLGKPEYSKFQFDEDKFEDIFSWLRKTFKQKTRDEWMEIFEGEDACMAPVLSQEEMVENPHVKAREMIVEFDDEKLGKTKTIGIPVKFSATPGRMKRSAPYLGEHTEEILLELGRTKKDIEKLKMEGIVK